MTQLPTLAPLLEELEHTWHSTIPLSQFMQVRPLAFDGETLEVSAPLAPNINLHHTMFAGSIYTLMTLSGWGMMWLQQWMAGVDGSIVLADAAIRYHAPVDGAPIARVRWPAASLMALGEGRKVRQALTVELWCDARLCATFQGLYVSLPKV